MRATYLITAALSFGAILLAASGARAQTATGFALDQFNPSERGSEWFQGDTLDLRGDPGAAVGVVGELAVRPLVLYNPDGTTKSVPVQDSLILHPGGTIVRKNLGTEPLPSTAWTGALGASWTPEEARTEEQRAALALAVGLAGEVRSADAALFAVPLYNFGIPQHVKTWIDLVMAGAENPNEALLAGKPAVLVAVRDGRR